jgi:hypothetical protein
MMSNALIFIACTACWMTDAWLLADLGMNGGVL